jgi:hypothetical protein
MSAKIRRRLEFTACQEFGPELNPPILVHGEHLDGRSADRREARNHRAKKREMFVPKLMPGVKKPLDPSGLGVNAREIRPLEGVASFAGDTKIVRVVCPAVLPRDDVFNVEGDERLGSGRWPGT